MIYYAAPGDKCIVCRNTRAKDPSVSMHWLNALRLKDEDIGSHDRVCSRHFPESSGVSGGREDAQDARAPPKAKECN